METNWITVREAANQSGYSVDYVRDLIRRHEISAKKSGWQYLVDEQSLTEYKRRQDQARAREG